MAEYTAVSDKNGFNFKLIITEEKQDIKNNQSTISFKFEMINDQSYATNWYGMGSDLSYEININGTRYTGNIGDYYDYDYNEDKIVNSTKNKIIKNSTTQIITHNTNGKKTINISFSVSDISERYFTCGSASKKGTFVLTDIPRVSSFSLPTTSVKVEDSIKATISSASESFTHKFGWYDPNTNKRIGDLISVSSLSPKIEIISDLYNYFLEKQTKKLVFQLRCGTYSGNTLIGYVKKDMTVSLSANRCTPIIENIEIGNIDQYKIGEIKKDNGEIESIVINENEKINVNITYKYGSDIYAKKIEGKILPMISMEIEKINTLIGVTDPKGFFTSNKKSLKDYKNYTAYFSPSITINTPSVEFEIYYEKNAQEEEEFAGYKITKIDCDIDYNYLSYYLLNSEQKNSFDYKYYLGVNREVSETDFSEYETPLQETIKIFYLQTIDSDIAITLNDLLSPLYLIIKYRDKITENEEIKEIRLSPLFDWGDNGFNFNIPVQINRDQTSGQAWYNTTTKVGGGLDMKNSDIIGANSIYFSDKSSSAGKGLGFPNFDAKEGEIQTYDYFKCYNGNIYFIPNFPNNNKSIKLLYGIGDIMILKDNQPLNGYITNDGKRIFISIPLDKPLSPLVTSFKFSQGTMQGRGVNGYIKNPATNAASGAFNFLDSTHKVTLSTSIACSNVLLVQFDFETAVTSSNNSTVSICPVGDNTITFS